MLSLWICCRQIGAGSSETREEAGAGVRFLESTVGAPQVIVGCLGAARGIHHTVGVQI